MRPRLCLPPASVQLNDKKNQTTENRQRTTYRLDPTDRPNQFRSTTYGFCYEDPIQTGNKWMYFSKMSNSFTRRLRVSSRHFCKMVASILMSCGFSQRDRQQILHTTLHPVVDYFSNNILITIRQYHHFLPRLIHKTVAPSC